MKKLLPIALSFAFSSIAQTPAANVTFTRDVARILYQHCVACHHPNDIAPMSLLTYKDARPWAAAIQQAVVTGKMPPWKADPHFGKWSNDPRLSPSEIATIKTWIDNGKLEGDPKDMPPAPTFPDGWKIGKPDAIIAIPEQTIEGSGPDQYVYINVPTNFTEDRWIVAAELRPGNRRIVHHAHVFIVDPPAPAKAAAKSTEKDPQKEYARWLKIKEGTIEWVRPEAPVIDNGCSVDDNGVFPGSHVSDLGSLISSYLPGREADVYPAGTARKIPAGASVNFQIHYSRTTGKKEVDATSVGLIFAKEPPRQISRRIDLSNHLFMIPAGDSDHSVTECHTFDKDILVTSLTPHMHLRGKSMRIVADLPSGEKKTLLYVPAYSFNWQITYRAEEPIFLPKGTRVEILATFDNSPNNPMNPDATKPVRWGSASETEMMDGWIEYLDAPPTTTTSAAQSLDYQTYKNTVEAIFLKKRPTHARCVVCHAAANHAFRLEPLNPGATAWTDEQSRRNFLTVSHLVKPGDPLSSLLLMQPLAHSAGGAEFHSGGRQFASQTDPDWQAIAAWVTGR